MNRIAMLTIKLAIIGILTRTDGHQLQNAPTAEYLLPRRSKYNFGDYLRY
ncbi:MAG: hypothetical protein AAF729_02550 [Pseudomonadota bacterium]